MPIEFEVQGINELIEEAEKMYGNVEEAEKAFLQAYGNEILEEEKNLVRVDTGATRDSLKVSGIKVKSGERYILIGDVDRKRGAIPYYLENGVVRKGRLVKFPFMRPAVYKRGNIAKMKGIEAFRRALHGN